MGGDSSDNEDGTPTDVAPADKDLPQIVTDAYQRWEERSNIDADTPATDAELQQIEQQLKDSTPGPESYPTNNDGEALPEKEDAAPDSGSEGGDGGGDGGGGDGGDGDGGGDRDGGGG